jgi:CRP-like cAMP-binding protein
MLQISNIHFTSFKTDEKKYQTLFVDFANLSNFGITKSQTLYVTHEQLANELGTARVVVSRLLEQMEDEGLVKLGRNKISLV